MIYWLPETWLTAHPDYVASMENTVTLANENTEEEPMAPVGRRSDNRKSVSSRYCILGKLPNCRVSSIYKYIVQRKQPDQHPGRDGREEQGRQSGGHAAPLGGGEAGAAGEKEDRGGEDSVLV